MLQGSSAVVLVAVQTGVLEYLIPLSYKARDRRERQLELPKIVYPVI